MVVQLQPPTYNNIHKEAHIYNIIHKEAHIYNIIHKAHAHMTPTTPQHTHKQHLHTNSSMRKRVHTRKHTRCLLSFCVSISVGTCMGTCMGSYQGSFLLNKFSNPGGVCGNLRNQQCLGVK